jgi:hypothetical protein
MPCRPDLFSTQFEQFCSVCTTKDPRVGDSPRQTCFLLHSRARSARLAPCTATATAAFRSNSGISCLCFLRSLSCFSTTTLWAAFHQLCFSAAFRCPANIHVDGGRWFSLQHAIVCFGRVGKRRQLCFGRVGSEGNYVLAGSGAKAIMFWQGRGANENAVFFLREARPIPAHKYTLTV